MYMAVFNLDYNNNKIIWYLSWLDDKMMLQSKKLKLCWPVLL